MVRCDIFSAHEDAKSIFYSSRFKMSIANIHVPTDLSAVFETGKTRRSRNSTMSAGSLAHPVFKWTKEKLKVARRCCGIDVLKISVVSHG